MMIDIIEFYLLNFSLTSLCGDRNDLSQYFNQNTSTTTNQSESQSSQTSTKDANNNSLADYDWNNLANNLLYSDESDMCQSSYVTGSGSIMQVVTVNRSCRCVLFDQLFNSNPMLNQFATLLRPILYGKIFYHPSNIYYDQIIQQINETFQSLDELVRLFRGIEVTLYSTYELFQSICDERGNSSSICQQLSTYKTSLNFFIILTEFIACSERNRFVAMNSEAEMISAGQIQSITNTFLAAIEFLDEIPNNQSLPKHIRFKIRMTLDYVDSTFRTEDR
jgi:hypothetical protein